MSRMRDGTLTGQPQGHLAARKQQRRHSTHMVRRSISHDDLLTSRQVEVLQFQASGMRPKEIADLLCVAEATVRMHVRNACSKLGVHSWFAAVMEARRRGLMDTPSN